MHVKLGAAVAALVLLSGCSNLITGGELIRPGEATGSIEVVNATSYQMDVVLISDCSQASYGLNRLPQGVSLSTGQSYTWTVSAGCWDVDGGSTYGMFEARQRMNVAAGGLVRYTITD